MADQPAALEGVLRILQINEAHICGHMLQLSAELGIADLLAAGPRDAAGLATDTGTDPDALHRLLRFLAGQGIFTEDEAGRFSLTPTGDCLRSDHPQSLLDLLRWSTVVSRTFQDARHSLRTGLPAFPEAFGQPLFEYLRDHPEVGGHFNGAMAGFSRLESAAVTGAYDFSGARVVVDVAGGDGTLLADLLKAHPAAEGVLLEQPHVVEDAARRFEAEGLAARCRVTSGDFFEEIPASGDLYILKSIIHDWADDDALRILTACRRAMAPGSRLLLIEAVVPPGNTPGEAKLRDVVMLTLLGGRERTQEEYAQLLGKAGLRLARVIGTRSPLQILEAVPAA
ncbi:acetylserotonin O-methyltransferase [Streptomyces sp. NBC_01537]|uniref:methyltransferase n=1 Tax=Streptomyces sp. NBC_01537 TaxID=2903896 RepID=UPI00386893A0